MKPNTYEIQYVLQARAGNALTPPDLSRANGCGEILETLYMVYQQGGADAVAHTWRNLCDDNPQLNHDFPAPRHITHVSRLHELPAPEWLIEGMLPARSLAEVHGAPGAGKSLLTLHLAAELADRHPVIYLAAEGVSGYRNRVTAWEAKHQKKIDKLYFDTEAVNLLDSQQVEHFILAVSAYQPALIIIDTLARCMIGGDENSAKDMGLVINACNRIIQQVGATILLVHHTGKGKGSSERGSSALRGACDAMIELANDHGIVTVISSKLKDGKPFEQQYYQMTEVEDSVVLVATDRKATSTQKGMAASDRKILEALELTIYAEDGGEYTRLMNNLEIPGSTLDKALSRLKDKAFITKKPGLKGYFITEAGRKALNGDDTTQS